MTRWTRLASRLRADAYTADALIEAGGPSAAARTLLADGPRAVLERPRLSLTGRRRGPPTTVYVWGPDAARLLSDERWEAIHGTAPG